MTRTIPVWLDCDPGLDDAVAILLGTFNPNFNLLGISTVHGNSSVEHCTKNALSLLTLLQRTDVPVYVGASHGLVKEAVFAPHIHGSDGFGGIDLPEPAVKPVNEPGDVEATVDAMYAACKKHAGEISMVAIGPITNVAKLFIKYPDAKEMVKHVVFMGGGIKARNVNFKNGGSFNVLGDPRGFNVVFQDPVLEDKILQVTMDCSFTVLCTKEIQEKILNVPHTTKIRQTMHDLMLCFADNYSKQQGFIHGPPVHDPICLYILLEKYGVKDVGIVSKRYHVTAVEEGFYESKLDFVESEDDTGAEIVTGINVQLFWDDLLEILELTDEVKN